MAIQSLASDRVGKQCLWYYKGMNEIEAVSAHQPSVTYHGAARMVTGTMHLVHAAGKRILLDCGSISGGSRDQDPFDLPFPFDPAEIDAVVLTHCHQDHCGRLASLVMQGFDGPIYTTQPSRDILEVLLFDTARIREQELMMRGRKHHGGPRPKVRFGTAEAHHTLDLVEVTPLGKPVVIDGDIELTLLEAGHILGSAMVHLAWQELGRTWRLTFTGDLGRSGFPFQHPHVALPPADLLLCESTYGGEAHDTAEMMAQNMARAIRRAASEGGKILIPAFSLGRTHIILHYLRKWMNQGVIPNLPIHVDSPLGRKLHKVFLRYPGEFSEKYRDDLEVDWLEGRDDATDVSFREGARIIVASGGMLEGGRILHHLRFHIDDPRATLLLVSYQAPGTLGEQILEKGDSVRFNGRRWNKWIDVVQVRGFSGHADHKDLLAAIEPLAGNVRQIRLVHGEPDRAEALAKALVARGFNDVRLPEMHETTQLS